MNRQDEKYISGYQNTSHNIDPLAWTRGEKVEAGDVDEASNLIPKKNSPNNRSILLGSYLLITIFFALFVYYLCFKQLFSHRMAFVTTGTRINFKSVDGRFVRVDGERTNTLILSEIIPWIAGSTFEVFVLPDGAWKLKSLSGYWVRAHDIFGEARADQIDKALGSTFIPMKPFFGKSIQLYVQETSQVLAVSDTRPESIASVVSTPPHYFSVLTPKTSFEVVPVNFIMGVNLGGWFIPEVWMVPSFFNGSGLGWGGSLCRMVNYSRELTEERILDRLENWIKEDDFRQMAEMGLNSIRLPIGYWNVMEDPYQRYAPADLSTSLHYIDWAFDMAQKYGMTVLLDLHGAPGSQNGIDHSGCSMYPQWQYDENVNLTLTTVRAMAERYGDRPNLVGFELMNEPNHDLEAFNHTLLLEFYQDAYWIIRDYSKTALVIFNELYSEYYADWKGELAEPEYFNVVVDWHLYDWPGNHTYERVSDHMTDALNWGTAIEEFTPHHPVIVGEWCFSTGEVKQVGQPFVDMCLDSFKRSLGWYIWTWRIEDGIGFEFWNVKHQHNDPAGIRIRKQTPIRRRE